MQLKKTDFMKCTKSGLGKYRPASHMWPTTGFTNLNRDLLQLPFIRYGPPLYVAFSKWPTSQSNCPPLYWWSVLPLTKVIKRPSRTSVLTRPQFFNKISLIALRVSAVCTVQQYPNVQKFHEAKLRPVSEKSGTRTKGLKNALWQFQRICGYIQSF